MTGWRVVRFAGSPEGAPYSVMATLEFGTTAQVEAALAAAGGPVLADVPRFRRSHSKRKSPSQGRLRQSGFAEAFSHVLFITSQV